MLFMKPRKVALGLDLELKIDSLNLDKALTHKEYCPRCIYAPDCNTKCPVERYTFSLDHCFNFTEENTSEEYLKKHCSICAKPRFKKCEFKKDLEWAVKNKKDHKKLAHAKNFLRKRIIFTDEDLRYINQNCRIAHHHYEKLIQH